MTTETLLGALAKALPTLDAAKKNTLNPHFKKNYADLGSVIDAIRPIAEHGLWFRQVSHDAEHGVAVETFYIHAGGELSAGKVFVPADKANAQGYGSAQTYARRYGLQLAFGLATEDDDGNAASAAPPKGTVRDKAESTVSPDGPDYPFPDGPCKGITQLKAAARGLWREIEGCGDDSELTPLLETPENKALLAQLGALEHPSHREIWEGDGKDNPGVAGLINKMREQFAVAEFVGGR